MPPRQELLFPDPRPLVERLGRDFFRQLPEQPGVYLMRDQAETVLYVGKARNLRRRLNSYRVANPDRLLRRHLRLLGSVARIELECCMDEAAALARESQLLRALRPRFNRAGTWPVALRFLSWRREGGDVELGVVEDVADGWQHSRPLGAGAAHLRAVLFRLLWLSVHSQLSASQLPPGWCQGRLTGITRVQCGALAEEATAFVENALAGRVDACCEWVQTRRPSDSPPFEQAFLAQDLEALTKMVPLRQGVAG